MFSRPEGSSEDIEWTNKTDYLASQAMVDISKSKNLAIKPNTFEKSKFMIVEMDRLFRVVAIW